MGVLRARLEKLAWVVNCQWETIVARVEIVVDWEVVRGVWKWTRATQAR